jgi:lysophospholipase L1-like esterase
LGFWRNIKPERFAAVYRQLLTKAVPEFDRVYAINIAPTNTAMEEHSPGLSKSIQIYNQLIKQAAESADASNLHLIDVHAAISAGKEGTDHYIIKSDGHHITQAGHDLYASLILACEKSLLR